MNRITAIFEAQISDQDPASRSTGGERVRKMKELDLEPRAPAKGLGFYFKLYYKVTDVGALLLFIWSKFSCL